MFSSFWIRFDQLVYHLGNLKGQFWKSKHRFRNQTDKFLKLKNIGASPSSQQLSLKDIHPLKV